MSAICIRTLADEPGRCLLVSPDELHNVACTELRRLNRFPEEEQPMIVSSLHDVKTCKHAFIGVSECNRIRIYTRRTLSGWIYSSEEFLPYGEICVCAIERNHPREKSPQPEQPDLHAKMLKEFMQVRALILKNKSAE